MKKKLIEVALPLEAINKEAARERSLRHGHPSTLHRWWSRKPLSAARAVLFATLVDDPSSHPESFPSPADQNQERQRLFALIERLVNWDYLGDRTLLDEALREIKRSTNGPLPTIYDPFCGGGSIVLEAQRLGLTASGSDLNPIAVLISKALAELPPTIDDHLPVNPVTREHGTRSNLLRGVAGLVEDIRYYGAFLRDQAYTELSHLYPQVRDPLDLESQYTAIAWLWVRAVPCPNPACGGQVPLLSKAWLSTKARKKVWIEPVLHHDKKVVTFRIESGLPSPEKAKLLSAGTSPLNSKGKKTKATFACQFCSSPGNTTTVRGEYIDRCATEGTMISLPLAIATEGKHGRLYLPFDQAEQLGAVEKADQEVRDGVLDSAPPDAEARGTFASNAQGRYYGFRRYCDYFTARQLRYLTTIGGLLMGLKKRILADGGSEESAKAIVTYLSLAMGRSIDRSSSLCVWDCSPKMEALRNTFAVQGLQMAWDYAEGNPFSESSGNWMKNVDWVAKVVARLPGGVPAAVFQRDIVGERSTAQKAVIVTDPPYYDNIEYSYLSDFFYVWYRPILQEFYPDLFTTMLVPKNNELVASTTRFAGNAALAEESFRKGFRIAFEALRAEHNWDYPCVIFYAFKQAESQESDEDSATVTVSTGWETMLAGLVEAGFVIDGTWPIRSELANRSNAREANSLASSIVLVCRLRDASARAVTRREFVRALKEELPGSLRDLQKGSIAPVDLAQAAIGPGMAVYSRFSGVLEADGGGLDVRAALGLINQTLDEVLSEQEGEFDPDTRWALAWFEQHAFDEGPYGEAEVLATAKALSVSALDETKILHSRAGKVRLLRRDELSADWNPSTEHRLTVWAVTQHLIRSLDKNGETATSILAGKVGELAEIARDLAYRLYVLSERKGWAEEAGYYNSLVVSWPAIAPKAFALS